MPKEFSRAQRVGELIHHTLARIIQRELPAREFGLLTVSNVKITDALDYAKVYITILNESPANIKKALALLDDNMKYIRHLLSQEVKLRITPQLKFFYDKTESNARHLSSLIDEVNSRK